MKKLTIAALLAVASFTASAQVTVTGKVSGWYDNTTTGSTTVSSFITEPTSNVAVTAKEDLGSGLSARVVVETSLQGNTINGQSVGTQVGDRQGTVGIANSLASIDVGRNVHSQFLAITNNDAFGTLYGSVAGDVHNLRGLRFSQASFISVTPVKGFNATYDRQAQGAGLGADALAYSLNASLLGANLSYARYELSQDTSDVLAGNFTLGTTRLYGISSVDKTAGVETKGQSVGVAQPLGGTPVTLKATYGHKSDHTRAYALGGDYNLSKRTMVGVAYRKVDATGTANDIRQIGLGLTHLF
jgi:predicted porin